MSNSPSISASDADRYYNQSIAKELGLTRCEFHNILLDVINRSVADGFVYGDPADYARLFAGLHWDDLLLARACACGYDDAWNRFLILYRTKLYGAAMAIAKEDSLARELADSLYADLFGTATRPDGCRISKLNSYIGRGPLEGWLRTVLAQTYVNRFRVQRRFVSFDETTGSDAIASTSQEDFTSGQTDVAKATDAALAGLSSEERLLLAAYYLDGRTLAQIGRMLALHESTVSRRLEKITAALRKQIVAKLRAGGMSKHEAQKLLELDVRDLAVDVRRALAQERQAGTF